MMRGFHMVQHLREANVGEDTPGAGDMGWRWWYLDHYTHRAIRVHKTAFNKALKVYCFTVVRCPSINSINKALTVVFRSNAACFNACLSRSGICTVIVVMASVPPIKRSI